MGQWGHFSDDGTEYVITRPRTSVPWINCITNNSYCAFVSHLGTGSSFVGQPDNYVLQHDPKMRGRLICVSETESNQSWLLSDYSHAHHFVTRVGQGYSTIQNTTRNVASEVTYFVPLSGTHELWMINLTNTSELTRSLKIYTCAEFAQPSGAAPAKNVSRDNISYSAAEALRFITANIPVDSYDHPHHPIYAQNPSGVLCFDITLKPQESVNFDIIMGVAVSEKELLRIKKNYSSRVEVEKALQDVRDFWAANSKKLIVSNQQSDDVWINTWLPLHARAAFLWPQMHARSLPGAPMHSIEVQAHRIMGILQHDASGAKISIQHLLAHQFKNGLCVDTWNHREKKTRISQDSSASLWLAILVINYVLESGDIEFLDTQSAYYDGGKGSVYDHLLASINYAISHKRGDHETQTKDLDTVSDTMTCYVIKLALPLLERRDAHDFVKQYKEQYHILFDNVNKQMWDGSWYMRSQDGSKSLVGSHKNKEGMLHLDAQTWPVIAHIADFDTHNASGTQHTPHNRGIEAIENVWKKLMLPYGPATLLPPYSHNDLVQYHSAGMRENGGVSLVSTAILIMAECTLSHGNEAYELWRKGINHIHNHTDQYKHEPYGLPEYIYGPSHVLYGQGDHTHLATSSAWMLSVLTEWIYGVRPTLAGLLIDPCVPNSWKTWRIEKEFRGSHYDLTFLNPRALNGGVKRMKLDGKMVEGNTLPAFEDNKTHIVTILLEK